MNNGNKRSTHLTDANVRLVMDGAAHAYRLGTPLNRTLNIHFNQAGITQSKLFITAFFNKFLNHMRGTGASSCWVYVIENEVGKGLHLHSALHVPASRQEAFSRNVTKWMTKLGATPRRHGAFKIGVIDAWNRPYNFPKDDPEAEWYLNPDFGTPLNRSGLKGWLGYMLKGTEPKVARWYGIYHQPQGVVYGKRCGASEAITIKARLNYRLPAAQSGSRQCPRRGTAFTQRMLFYQGYTHDTDYQPPLD